MNPVKVRPPVAQCLVLPSTEWPCIHLSPSSYCKLCLRKDSQLPGSSVQLGADTKTTKKESSVSVDQKETERGVSYDVLFSLVFL